MKILEICLRCDGWSGICVERVGWGEAGSDFLADGKGNGGRSGWWYNGNRRGVGIDRLREDDRGVFEVHAIAGGQCLVDHRLKLAFDFNRRV